MSLLRFAKAPDSLVLPKAADWTIPFLTSESPALEAMTDFRCAPAISVPENTQIDDALNRMIHSGVRLLFVVDSSFKLLGAVSSHDIQGERPMLYLQSQDCNREHCSRADVTVRHVMEPLTAWHTLTISALEHATVGDLVSRFRDQSRRHIIVIETPGNATSFVRGVISASFLERALGSPVETSHAAQNFAEMGLVLAR
ncbi:CBS domain containing protein [Burkholderiales bacterium GJ-E10]|nr:CBS domain containing protein [Burkholderiales bacterium GJ-E10]